jgi:hypothetical protein
MGSNQSSDRKEAPATTSMPVVPDNSNNIDNSSSSNNNSNNNNNNTGNVDDDVQNHERPTSSKRASPKSSLSGIALVEHRCRRKKRLYNKCVADHYTNRFLTGKSIDPEDADCDTLFDSYKQCYMKGLLRERAKQNLPPPREGTMLYEFMEEEGLLSHGGTTSNDVDATK